MHLNETDEATRVRLTDARRLRVKDDERWYFIWDILYPAFPRPDSPFASEYLEEMLGLARSAHRFYREQIGDDSIAQLLADHSRGIITMKDMEESIEALVFDAERVRAYVRLMTSENSRQQQRTRKT
jgi:hypothetical protein